MKKGQAACFSLPACFASNSYCKDNASRRDKKAHYHKKAPGPRDSMRMSPVFYALMYLPVKNGIPPYNTIFSFYSDFRDSFFLLGSANGYTVPVGVREEATYALTFSLDAAGRDTVVLHQNILNLVCTFLSQFLVPRLAAFG